MDCGIQCSIDKKCFSFKYENSICHHGGIQQLSNEIEAEVFMQKLIGKLKRQLLSQKLGRKYNQGFVKEEVS